MPDPIGKSARILIVDDDELNIQILEELLGETYSLRCASDGATALAEAARFRPDLILLDVMMPGLNGYETARSLREIPELAHTKIILVSAKARVSDRLMGYDAGADDYITKPFDHDELTAKVQVFLRLKTAEETERLQRELLSVLGHQFRTPLTHVMGAAELLSLDGTVDGEARQQLITTIVGGASRMAWLLDYVNHFHAIRTGSIAAAANPVPLREVTEDVVRDLASLAGQKQVGVVVETSGDGGACADRYHLSFLLHTLLSEAIAASPRGESVRVTLTSEGRDALLHVNDRRAAIDPAIRDRLFSLFWVDDIQHHGGEISSLPLAREISRRYGGDLHLEASSEEGTTFVLRVPLSQPGETGLERAA